MVVGALVLIPLVTLGFLQVLMSISGVENLPRWLRSLGVVTELQGRLFLVGLVAIVVMIAAMIYTLITAFEFLGRKDELEKITNKSHYTLKFERIIEARRNKIILEAFDRTHFT